MHVTTKFKYACVGAWIMYVHASMEALENVFGI